MYNLPHFHQSNFFCFLDYVYFETPQQQQQSVHHQQQQPFQIRRIEELNKTAGGNVEAKVMCFYRRRDLPAQLIALADKHQQHQQQQQLSLTLSLSPSGNSSIKGSSKQIVTVKASSVTDKDVVTDKKEQDASGTVKKKEQRQVAEDEQAGIKVETFEKTEIVKNEQEGVEVEETQENDCIGSTVIKSIDSNDCDVNNKSKYI